eukprot:5647362-Pleurochrysis_carterae.AAC.5
MPVTVSSCQAVGVNTFIVGRKRSRFRISRTRRLGLLKIVFGSITLSAPPLPTRLGAVKLLN